MGARDKGSAFEREVAKDFTERFNENFRRTPLSGGFDKNIVQGDIFCNNKKFSLVIECKNHKRLSIPQWWRQVRDDAKKWKIPVLVFKFSGRYHSTQTATFKQNVHGKVALLKVKDYLKLGGTIQPDFPIINPESKLNVPKYFGELYVGHKAVVINTHILTGKQDSYILIMLDDFLGDVRTDRCYKRIIGIRPRYRETSI